MVSKSLGQRLWRLLPTTRENARTLEALAKSAATSVAVARTYVRTWVAKGAIGESVSKHNPRQKVFWRLQSEYISTSRSWFDRGQAMVLVGHGLTSEPLAPTIVPSSAVAFRLVTANTMQARRYRPLQDPQDAARLVALMFEPLAVSVHASVRPEEAACLLRRAADALEQWPASLTNLPATHTFTIEENGQTHFDITSRTTPQDEADLGRWVKKDTQDRSPRSPGKAPQDRHHTGGSSDC